MSHVDIKRTLKISVGYSVFENALYKLCNESGLKRKELIAKLKEQNFILTGINNGHLEYKSDEFNIIVAPRGLLWFVVFT